MYCTIYKCKVKCCVIISMVCASGCRSLIPVWIWWRDARRSIRTCPHSLTSSSQSEHCFSSIFLSRVTPPLSRFSISLPLRFTVTSALPFILMCLCAGPSQRDLRRHSWEAFPACTSAVQEEETHPAEALHSENSADVSETRTRGFSFGHNSVLDRLYYTVWS